MTRYKTFPKGVGVYAIIGGRSISTSSRFGSIIIDSGPPINATEHFYWDVKPMLNDTID